MFYNFSNTDHCGITSVIFNIFRRNIDDKFGSFAAAQVNELVCTSELGE